MNCNKFAIVVGQRYDVVDEIDETRKFNFWTHQLFIFFVMKFFPAYHNYTTLQQLAQQRAENPVPFCKHHTDNCICRGRPSVVEETATVPASAAVDFLVPPKEVTPVPSLPEET